jgi:hypothetical protein
VTPDTASTTGAVLEDWASGKTREEAIRAAQAAGFAEADAARDLSGRDSAGKLVLMSAAVFGQWFARDAIPTRGIDTIDSDPAVVKLIARTARAPTGISASIAPERPSANSFLGQARLPEARDPRLGRPGDDTGETQGFYGAAASSFAVSHLSTSDRSHPPEACLRGNRPFFVHLKSVDRFTPTTRSTSAVLILWSRWASRSGLGSAGTTVTGRGG